MYAKQVSRIASALMHLPPASRQALVEAFGSATQSLEHFGGMRIQVRLPNAERAFTSSWNPSSMLRPTPPVKPPRVTGAAMRISNRAHGLSDRAGNNGFAQRIDSGVFQNLGETWVLKHAVVDSTGEVDDGDLGTLPSGQAAAYPYADCWECGDGKGRSQSSVPVRVFFDGCANPPASGSVIRYIRDTNGLAWAVWSGCGQESSSSSESSSSESSSSESSDSSSESSSESSDSSDSSASSDSSDSESSDSSDSESSDSSDSSESSDSDSSSESSGSSDSSDSDSSDSESSDSDESSDSTSSDSDSSGSEGSESESESSDSDVSDSDSNSDSEYDPSSSSSSSYYSDSSSSSSYYSDSSSSSSESSSDSSEESSSDSSPPVGCWWIWDGSVWDVWTSDCDSIQMGCISPSEPGGEPGEMLFVEGCQ